MKFKNVKVVRITPENRFWPVQSEMNGLFPYYSRHAHCKSWKTFCNRNVPHIMQISDYLTANRLHQYTMMVQTTIAIAIILYYHKIEEGGRLCDKIYSGLVCAPKAFVAKSAMPPRL